MSEENTPVADAATMADTPAVADAPTPKTPVRRARAATPNPKPPRAAATPRATTPRATKPRAATSRAKAAAAEAAPAAAPSAFSGDSPAAPRSDGAPQHGTGAPDANVQTPLPLDAPPQVVSTTTSQPLNSSSESTTAASEAGPEGSPHREQPFGGPTPEGVAGMENFGREGFRPDGRLRFRGREGREMRPGRTFRPREGNEGRPEGRPEGNGYNENRQGGSNPNPNGQNGGRRGNRFGPQDGREGQNRDNNYQQPPRRAELELAALEEKSLTELRDIAKELDMTVPAVVKKNELMMRILEVQAELAGNLIKRGIIEIQSDGKGFLRCSGYLPADGDVYVSQSQIKRFNLKTGDMVTGLVRAPKEMERFHGLLRVEAINGETPEAMKNRKEFEKLTPIFPEEKFKLEIDQGNITARIIDLVSPIGKGQRGLIVAPPKAGKTTLLKSIANSISLNHPDVTLIVLLIDERPEEVTDISRSVKGEVVASTFDEMPENHMRVAELVFDKAKRLVEQHKDVVILLDSITRLSRASNLVVTPSGRTLSGGLDPAAMYRPKRMFGAARNIEEGGSLTILATTLVDTGSRMDEMIFEEFKGTGNLDLVLDRDLFNQRIFPAIDINKSGTRRDDLLLSKEDLAAVFHLRRTLAALDNDKAITLLIDRLKNTRTNTDFMAVVQRSQRNSANPSVTGG